MSKTCECAAQCGDDPEVVAGRVLGCATFRARRNPDHLGAQVDLLRGALQGVVTVMDGMEPDVPWEDRASDEAWDTAKAEANRVLAATS